MPAGFKNPRRKNVEPSLQSQRCSLYMMNFPDFFRSISKSKRPITANLFIFFKNFRDFVENIFSTFHF
jgi:hypothetical protein